MRNCTLLSLLALAFCANGTCLQADQVLTYPDLVRRITDLEYLATLPQEGEKCLQWSSYDRKSKLESGKYQEWDANGDNNGHLRMEGEQMVIGEMDGPGCIWRIWSATPEQGHVKIILDGNSTPAVDLPFIEYFNRAQSPFNYTELNHTVAMGWNCYIPIPFQKSCKIVADPGWGHYYHFTYSTFAKGTVVPTFTRNLDPDSLLALMQANDTLQNSGDRPAEYQDVRRDGKIGLKLEPGKALEVAKIKGPRAITAIRARVKHPEDEEQTRNILRQLVIKITWDDDADPSVFVPFGDFFGTAAGANEYRSLPCGLIDGEWYSYWYMPFEKMALVEIINESDSPQVLFMNVEHAELKQPIEKLARFHAKWHRDTFPAPEPERAAIDWSVLNTEGTGRFCGMMLHVWNPRGSWWGEGDEKFHIDGEKFPSTFGTGSEDYFGYAWCSPILFQNGLHNQTISMGNKGHVSVNRWHISDNLPFHTSFEGYIEKYYSNARPSLYATTVYWYLAPGGKDPYPQVPVSERIGYWGPIQQYKVQGAIEGEKMKILSCSGGKYEVQDLTIFSDGNWSGDEHLWWKNPSVGNQIALEFAVQEKGTFELKVAMTRAKDYGIFQLSLDGKKIGEPIDLYDPNVVPTGALTFGKFQLEPGKHTLGFELTGKNEKSIPNHMLGLDYILLVSQ
jgi:hypothetical protein